jgi:hypothetical protein
MNCGKGWKPFTGKIPLAGRVEITGDMDGDGVLVFINGDVFSARTAVSCCSASALEHALEVCRMGDVGHPLHDNPQALEARHSEAVMQVLEDHALVALRFIEALHRGEPGFFRQTADALRDRAKPRKDESFMIRQCVMRACYDSQGLPTVESVAVEWEAASGEKLPRRTLKQEKDGKEWKAVGARRLERFKYLLESEGWGWLPHRKRGDTLKRNRP